MSNKTNPDPIPLNPPVPVPVVGDHGEDEKIAPVDGVSPAAGTEDSGKEEVEMIDGRPRDTYDRFTKSQKRRIVAIVSYSAFLSRMSQVLINPSPRPTEIQR
jgi:hypothetical protein